MGKASSSKKVARAARAGGSESSGKRNWLFGVSLFTILVLGAGVVVFARSSSKPASAQPPAPGDHWHAAYGVYVCDKFLPAFTDASSDLHGIHTHGDGIMHIHPFTPAFGGKNATTGVFFDQVGVKVSADGFTMPSGTAYKNGYLCNGKPSKVTITKWPDVLDNPKVSPTVFTTGFDKIGFSEQWSAFTIAVVPDGTTVPKPDLKRLTDVRNGAPETPTATTAATTAATATASTTVPPGAPSNSAPASTSAPSATTHP